MKVSVARLLGVLSLTVAFCAGQEPPQGLAHHPETFEDAKITVQVDQKPEMVITERELSKMPRRSMTVKEHGTAIQYEGVLLHDILARAGAPFGDQLKGKALSSYVMATARDGYAVVYTLTEMDPAFSEGDLFLADRNNGAPLSENQGPFRIVAPHDRKPARSLRMLERIDVVQLKK
jgi:hypothetical protein